MRLAKLVTKILTYPFQFSRMLMWPAVRARSKIRAWCRELDAQPSWRAAYERSRFSKNYTVNQGGGLWWGSFKNQREGIEHYLELGSWEGQSTMFAAWLFPRAHLTAVDWFANPEADAKFDFNTQPFADRLEKVKGTTWDVLNRFAADGRRFDLIYIDADHRFDTVLLDTILSWPLLKIGGFLIWDDYLWSAPAWPSRLNPKLAIDTWLSTRSPSIEVVFAGRQVCVQKIADDPRLMDMSGRPTWTDSPVSASSGRLD